VSLRCDARWTYEAIRGDILDFAQEPASSPEVNWFSAVDDIRAKIKTGHISHNPTRWVHHVTTPALWTAPGLNANPWVLSLAVGPLPEGSGYLYYHEVQGGKKTCSARRLIGGSRNRRSSLAVAERGDVTVARHGDVRGVLVEMGGRTTKEMVSWHWCVTTRPALPSTKISLA